MDYRTIWLTVSQTLFLVAGAPLLVGVIRWVKCELQNRTAPSIWQPYLNLNKLFRKEVLISTATSSLFRLVPFLVFSITLLIAATLPLFVLSPMRPAFADVIVIIGLLALIRFLLALAAMDTGAAFGGMGASRELFISALGEPAMFLVFFAIAMLAASTNLVEIITYLSLHNLYLSPVLILAAFGLVLVALAETGRVPIDNPTTHLELTMVHEAMILEYSGRYLALLEWSSAVKLAFYAALIINLFFPWGIAQDFTWEGLAVSVVAFLGKMLIVAIMLGVAEVSLAKLRLFRVPNLLGLAFIFGVLAVLIRIIGIS